MFKNFVLHNAWMCVRTRGWSSCFFGSSVKSTSSYSLPMEPTRTVPDLLLGTLHSAATPRALAPVEGKFTCSRKVETEIIVYQVQ